jgi:hypothetical protein
MLCSYTYTNVISGGTLPIAWNGWDFEWAGYFYRWCDCCQIHGLLPIIIKHTGIPSSVTKSQHYIHFKCLII